MPYYLFENKKTGEIREVFFHMNEEKIYFDEKGTKWNRIFTKPQAKIDSQIDAMSEKDFVEKTGKKNLTLGDMWDMSREASQKREKLIGNDPVKEKSDQEYSKVRQGRKRRPRKD